MQTENIICNIIFFIVLMQMTALMQNLPHYITQRVNNYTFITIYTNLNFTISSLKRDYQIN